LSTAKLPRAIKDRDIGSFVKHSAEVVISTNPIGAAAVDAFELGSSVVQDIQAKDMGKAVKDTVEGAALSTGAFYGVPGFIVGGAVAVATEFSYHLLGHSHPNETLSESISDAENEPNLSLDHLKQTNLTP
jgi:hypothetical protein